MPAPDQSPAMEEGHLLPHRRGSSGLHMEVETTANHILASVKEQELQFERLTRELEVERQIVANQLERCRLEAESPGDASSSSSEKSLPWRSADVSTSGDAKSRLNDSSQSPSYRIRTESEQVSLYSPEQATLHESEGSTGNSRTSTLMNSYADSGYQEAGGGYYGNQKSELRQQHSFPGTGNPGPATLIRNARAEGQAAQPQPVPGRAMRRVCSVPSRTQSPQYASGVSPSRCSLRVTGSGGGGGVAYGSPIVTEPKPLSSIFSATLPHPQRAPASASSAANPGGGGGGGGGGGSPYSTQRSSPAALRRVGSSTSRSGGSRNTSPYQVPGGGGGGGGGGRMGSPLVMAGGVSPPLTKQPGQSSSSSPARGSMTAVPQHFGSATLPRSLMQEAPPYGPHDGRAYGPQDVPPYGPQDVPPYGPHEGQPYGPQDPPPYGPHEGSPYGPHDAPLYGPHGYEIYERMNRPDSLTDALVDDNSQGLRSSYSSQMGQDLRSAMSPDRHITHIYEDQTFQGPVYRSPGAAPQGTLYRSTSGVGSLQRTASQRSTMTYARNNYAPAANYADPYRLAQYRPGDAPYGRHGPVAMDDSATRSPSIDSIQKDPREFAWRDPELPEVIHMLQHQFPSVQANAAAYLQHLCYGDNRTKVEVCRLGGIKHLVDLLDHKVLDVQKNACGALRNLVYGKALDDNKAAVRSAGGVPALLRLLRKTVDAEVRELVTGVLWNLSSCDAVKMTIIRDALTTMTNTVIIPHSGWSSSTFDDDHKLKFHTSLVLRNTTGCLRNLSSAGEEARKQLRTCEGLVDSLLYVIKACVNTSDFDSKIVENCICTLRNLSYRLELEMPPSRLLGGQELAGLLDGETADLETDSSCWGRKKKRKKRSLQEDTWDGVGPIPGFSKPPQGAEMLWHPAVVKPYLTLLAESSNPATLEGAAGSLQNLSAGHWKFASYIRAAVRKEKGLPILVELLRMDNDRVVCSVATALRNMALDVRNKELIGKYAMRDLVNRLPGGSTTQLSDETVAAVCCTLHEVSSRNMENAKALADTGGIEKLVNITKTRGDRYSLKVVKAAAQVLNTLWQYRDLRTIYKKDGWNQNHFLTPVSTLERDRFRSAPSLPTGSIQMSPVNHTVGSTVSSPAVLGIKESRSEYQRAPSTMQFYNHQGDNSSVHKNQYTGSGKPSPHYYSSPTREEPRRTQPVYYAEDPGRRNYESYRMYLQAPRGYDEPYMDEVITYPPAAADYVSHHPHGLKSTTNYVDFYSSTRRPSYRGEHYPGSPTPGYRSRGRWGGGGGGGLAAVMI
ncbi:plakophilin-4 isoform X3 [Gadus morhua]|uniref:plakophilin-4 isoform X3 n=1 Tax=Gadus morhua TaxID=8049 RepID=UPI0011B366FA|nr:plakophilin-4 isoform X3 [Gadus morhua]